MNSYSEKDVIDLFKEISKSKPNPAKLRSLLIKLEIELKADHLDQMSVVLQHFNQNLRPALAVNRKEQLGES